MRVAVITPAIRPGGGPAGYVHNWQRAVLQFHDALTHDYAFHGRSSSSRTLELPAGLTEDRIAYRMLQVANRLTHGRVRLARDTLSQYRPEMRRARQLIHASDLAIFQAFQPLQLPRLARRLGKQLLYMPHSPTPTADERAMMRESKGSALPEWERQQLLKLEEGLIRVADGVVFPSPGAADAYTREFGLRRGVLDNVKFIPSGVPDPGQPAARRGLSGQITVAFAGRYVSHKGFDLYCQAAKQVAASDGGVRFVCLGSGPIAAQPPVIDLGWLQKPYEVLREVSVVVVANRVAYYDLLPLEIAALGVPLVMTAVGGNVDQAARLPDVELSPEATADSLASAIRAAVSRVTSDAKYGLANRRSYEQNFTQEAFAHRWDRAISEVDGGKWD